MPQRLSLSLKICKKCKHCDTEPPNRYSDVKTYRCDYAPMATQDKKTGKIQVALGFTVPNYCPYPLEHLISFGDDLK